MAILTKEALGRGSLPPKTSEAAWRILWHAYFGPDRAGFAEVPIKAMDVSTMTGRALSFAGFRSSGEVARMCWDDLCTIRHLGAVRRAEVFTALRELQAGKLHPASSED